MMTSHGPVIASDAAAILADQGVTAAAELLPEIAVCRRVPEPLLCKVRGDHPRVAGHASNSQANPPCRGCSGACRILAPTKACCSAAATSIQQSASAPTTSTSVCAFGAATRSSAPYSTSTRDCPKHPRRTASKADLDAGRGGRAGGLIRSAKTDRFWCITPAPANSVAWLHQNSAPK